MTHWSFFIGDQAVEPDENVPVGSMTPAGSRSVKGSANPVMDAVGQ